MDPQELQTRYYFRIDGSLTDAAMAFGQVEVLSEDGETAFLTEPISGREAAEQAQACRCWPACGCWDKPQTAAAVYTGTGGSLLEI